MNKKKKRALFCNFYCLVCKKNFGRRKNFSFTRAPTLENALLFCFLAFPHKKGIKCEKTHSRSTKGDPTLYWSSTAPSRCQQSEHIQLIFFSCTLCHGSEQRKYSPQASSQTNIQSLQVQYDQMNFLWPRSLLYEPSYISNFLLPAQNSSNLFFSLITPYLAK